MSIGNNHIKENAEEYIGVKGLLLSGRKISELNNDELLNELKFTQVQEAYYILLTDEIYSRIK